MIGLAFSGGKDSWACLHLYKDQLKDITVLWVNTGKNYPEALKMIALAKAMCPNFIEITVDRDMQNEAFGLPSDIIPFSNTVCGQAVTGKTDLKIQSYYQCCAENISIPLHNKIKELGITHLISGKRSDEGHLSSCNDGDVISGITHICPNQNMTRQNVLDYLNTVMDVPAHFYFEHSSLDCYDCSAFLKDTKDISEWAKINHADLYEKKMIRIHKLRSALIDSMAIYGELQ